jgi:hypothetical protein
MRVCCPFCFRYPAPCCRCDGTGRIVYAENILQHLWDVPGCACETCERLRHGRLTITPEWKFRLEEEK